ncbi:MAG: hypothetical protein V3V01_08925 [Acidimicrobiales bacterium]
MQRFSRGAPVALAFAILAGGCASSGVAGQQVLAEEPGNDGASTAAPTTAPVAPTTTITSSVPTTTEARVAPATSTEIAAPATSTEIAAPATSTEIASPTTIAGAVAEPAAVENREAILRLASLPLYGGGTFDPETLAGKNVLLWFWGAH